MTELEIRANVEKNKKAILDILREVKRPGMEGLINYLESSDFFTAPASTRYHSNYEGGLAEHSLLVYKIFKKKNDEYEFGLSQDTIAICSLLHDICKVNFYTLSTRNKKNETTGKWEQVPYYAVDDQVPLGHGEKSVIILQNFIRLAKDEMYAIRCHMGGYEPKENLNMISAAWGKCPWAACLHTADLEASYLLETHVEY